jgi:hypothetical protein
LYRKDNMSADTGIYIAKFSDGYRCTGLVQAIENIDYFPKGSKERKETLKDYFGRSLLFPDKKSALLWASELDEKLEEESKNGLEYYILEYGIQYLGEYEDFDNDNPITKIE